ncbi:MAG: ABC transporter substrate-binding protein [Armatimonadetes bacterium]|nr:ABC transporter substrate-binding protein [Armatimonadota bacterium]
MKKLGFWNAGLIVLALGSLALMAGCKPKDGGGESTGSTGSSSSTSGETASGDKINIGLIASINGDLRPWGSDCRDGAMLAVEEINAAGGIDGKMINLIVEDSNSKPEDGKTAAQKLASSDVVGLVGEVASGITMQIKSVALEAGLPLVAVGATNPDITKNSDGKVFRVCYTDDFQGPVMAKFAFQALGKKRAAIMTDNKQPYSQELSKKFMAFFKSLGGEIVTEEFYESGQNQFTGQITNIKSKAPDVIFLSGYFTEVGPIARQIRQQGLNVPLLGGDGWDSKELVTSGGDAIIGGYFCNHYNNKEDRPEVQNFLTKWNEKYGGEPATTMGALGYDAVMLMIDGIKRGGTDKAKIAEALNNTEGFAGVSGVINLKDHNGDPPKRALVVEVTQDGQKFAKAYEPDEVFN